MGRLRAPVPPGQDFSLSFGGGSSLGLLYNSIAGDGSGFDTSLYGLALNGRAGGGIAQFGGMAYFSSVRATTNLVSSAIPAAADAAKPKAPPKPGTDHLITQNIAVNSGKLQDPRGRSGRREGF